MDKREQTEVDQWKTEFILIGSKQELQKARTFEIIKNGQIERSKKIKHLEADLDEQFSLKEMITRNCRTARGNLICEGLFFHRIDEDQ